MPNEIIFIGGTLRFEEEKYKFTEEINKIQNSNHVNGCKVEPLPARHCHPDGNGGLVYYRSWEISGSDDARKECAAKIERIAHSYSLNRLTKEKYENIKA